MNVQDNRPGESEGGEEPFDFERALERIETIVHALEDGRGGLDESLSLYEEGVKLLRRCHGLLRKAEQRIELLAGWDEAAEAITEPFDARETFPSSPVAAGPVSPASPGSSYPSSSSSSFSQKADSTSAGFEHAEPSDSADSPAAPARGPADSPAREDASAGQASAPPAQSAGHRGGRRTERP